MKFFKLAGKSKIVLDVNVPTEIMVKGGWTVYEEPKQKEEEAPAPKKRGRKPKQTN